MKRLAGPVNLQAFASRSLSRSSRAPASIQNAVARLITGFAATALLLAAQTSGWLHRGPFVDTLHSMSPAATLPVLHSVPAHRLASEPRSPARSTNGPAAGLPAFARPTFVRDAAYHVEGVAFAPSSASIAGRGYDATAPPALS
ncbi:MAG TPA: hypothetical protein VNS10_18105 [Gemmatimonadaceae bacterium]|nr:hypothetical protein [Gemmatimonadaceae bacterium]